MRGETVMRGYLDDPEATAAAIDADGFLHTGDLGTFDADGYLRIVGRIKDMFIVGGFNAYPAEIENLLLRHPRDRAGGGDRRSRRRASARSAWRSSCSTPGDRDRRRRTIIEWARGEMANYKVPRVVEFLDALPVNATGKVVKDELRARATRRRSGELMARVPVAEGVFTWPADDPQLIGSRCTACGIVTFPAQESCPRCASTEMAEHLLARRGSAVGVDDAGLPAAVAAVRRADGRDVRAVRCRLRRALGEVKVEARLTESDPDVLAHGMEMELVLVPFRTDDDGNEVVTFAFRPVALRGSARHDDGRRRSSVWGCIRSAAFPACPAIEMGAIAIRRALADAGVEWRQIEFAFGGSYEVDNPDAVVALLGLTGIPFTDVYNGCATAASALTLAAQTIRLGEYGPRHRGRDGQAPAGRVQRRPAPVRVPVVVRRGRA